MCMEYVRLSLALESAFRHFTIEVKFTRDGFQNSPTETIESALNYLKLLNIITDGECSDLCNELDFGKANLQRVLNEDSSAKAKINELLHFLKKRCKNILEEDEEVMK